MANGEKIKKARKARFPDDAAFARRIGVSAEELKRIEARGTGTNEKLLGKIAKELGAPVANLR